MIELTAKQAADAIRSGALDAAEYFEFYRDRAASDPYNSYIWVAEEAPEIDTRKPFAGVPIAIKDLFCTEGIPSQAGSKILEDYRPPYSATSVKKLTNNAGSTLLGKTNQDEFAMGSSTENSAYGPTRTPGTRRAFRVGSSGGSRGRSRGAPRARGRSARTGGSIRQPAALSGIVGMKPTRRDVPLRHDRVRVLAGPGGTVHPRRDRQRDAAVGDGRRATRATPRASVCRSPCGSRRRRDLKGIRLGVPRSYPAKASRRASLQAIEESLELARRSARTVETTHLPHAPHGVAAYYLIAPGGVRGEPRPLRRRALRLPQAGRSEAAGHVRPDA